MSFFITPYIPPAKFGGFAISRRLGRISSAERRQCFLNEKCTSCQLHLSRSACGFFTEIFFYYSLITDAGGGSFYGITSVKFSSLGMAIGRFLLHNV